MDDIDPFDFHAELWRHQARILAAVSTLAERHDLDPALVEAFWDAFRENDEDAFWEATADFVEAYAKAKGVDISP